MLFQLVPTTYIANIATMAFTMNHELNHQGEPRTALMCTVKPLQVHLVLETASSFRSISYWTRLQDETSGLPPERYDTIILLGICPPHASIGTDTTVESR